MSSLIANQVKANVCLVSVKLFIVLTTFVALFTLNWYNNNYNNNCLFNTIIRYSAHNLDSLFTRNRNTRLIDYNSLSSAMCCPFIVQQDQSNKRSWTGRFAYSASRELYFERLHSHTCLSVMLIVIGILGLCSMQFAKVFAYVYLMLMLLVANL